MDDAELRERTKKTAARLFHTVKGGAGYDLWKRFDPGLARQLSMFFAGTLYSREVIPQRERELCAVASLTVLNRTHELRAHIHAALNVGATRRISVPYARPTWRKTSGLMSAPMRPRTS